jgi:hypothetical protein
LITAATSTPLTNPPKDASIASVEGLLLNIIDAAHIQLGTHRKRNPNPLRPRQIFFTQNRLRSLSVM